MKTQIETSWSALIDIKRELQALINIADYALKSGQIREQDAALDTIKGAVRRIAGGSK